MLFNSVPFIFVFLPVILLVYWSLHSAGRTAAALIFLIPASLLFYAIWNPPLVLLLIGSIAFNFWAGNALGRNQSKCFLALCITANLLLLAWFKYAMMLTATVNAFSHTSLSVGDIILPLGISFFTFHQITYLVDIYKGIIKPSHLRDYALYVSFFPQLIAGPIVRTWEIIPQFQNFSGREKFWRNMAFGSALFVMGLFKKVIIADTLATYASPIFARADKGAFLSFFDGWSGALAYTFQLYFDFSGYSDMALGLALMLGFVLPINFLSPYKSTSIIEFWQRWHITLSRFFRDYVYISMGGNRGGRASQIFNLSVTMLLAGLWHGANWTFAAWGLLHGIFLVINHIFSGLREKHWPKLNIASWPYKIFAHILTMLAVVVGWVLFRTENFGAATRILKAMSGVDGIVLPLRVFKDAEWLNNDGLLRLPGVDEKWIFTDGSALPWIAAAYILCLALPASAEYFRIAESDSKLKFELNARTAVAFGLMAAVALFSLQRISEFLYFQF